MKVLAPTLETTAKTALALKVINAKGEDVPDATVRVVKDADDIVTKEAETQTTNAEIATVRYDLNDFSGKKQFSVEVTKDGFFSNSTTFDITAGEDSLDHEIIITADTTKVKGISVKKETIASINDQPLVIEAAGVEGDKKPAVMVKVAKGTVMRSADGTALTGKVEAKVAQFDPTKEESLAAFPGGFSASIDNPEKVNAAAGSKSIGGGETKKEIVFQSAGFTAIEMKVGGKKVEKFDTPISISMLIPKGTINPKTSKAVAVGDIIPIWSYDAAKDKWSYEGEGAVVNNDNKTPANLNDDYLEVPYKASHLSYWNLDWHYGKKCNPKLLIKSDRAGNPNYPNRLGMKIKMSLKERGYGRTNRNAYRADGFIQLNNIPVAGKIGVLFYDPLLSNEIKILSVDGVAFDAKKGFNLCGAPVVNGKPTLTLVLKEKVIERVDLKIKVEVKTYCSNDKQQAEVPIKNAYVYAYLRKTSGRGYIRLGSRRTGADGTVSYSRKIPKALLASGTYRLRAYGSARVGNRWRSLRYNKPVNNANTIVSFKFPQTCTLPNIAPIANAGADISMIEGEDKKIVGGGSDSDSTQPLKFQWKEGSTLLSKTATVSLKTLSATTGSALDGQPHKLILTVWDKQGGRGSDTVNVTVKANENKAPTAKAGSDFTIIEGDDLALKGSGTDPEDNPKGNTPEKLSYQWSMKGSSVPLPSGANISVSSLSLPLINDKNTDYTFGLLVRDAKGKVSPVDEIVITVRKNNPPTANANVNNTDYTNIIQGQAINLVGLGNDADNDPLGYSWKEGNVSYGTTATVGIADTSSWDIGTHSLTFMVSDGRKQTTALLDIVIVANQPPVAKVGANIITIKGLTVKLSASGSKDPDGSISTYEWYEGTVLLGRGENITLVGQTALVVGRHNIKLKVTDNFGKMAEATLNVVVLPVVKINDVATFIETFVTSSGCFSKVILGRTTFLKLKGSLEGKDFTGTGTLLADFYGNNQCTGAITRKDIPVKGSYELSDIALGQGTAIGTIELTVVIGVPPLSQTFNVKRKVTVNAVNGVVTAVKVLP